MSSTLAYSAYLERDGPSEWALVVPDVPEATFGASSKKDVWANAAGVLALALCSYPDRKLPFPAAGPPQNNAEMITIPATESAKLFIRQAMASQDLTVADLARMFEIDHKSARRVVSLRHNTRMDFLEAVLAKLGVRVALMAA
jgi:antitoxin HicB